jgi:hypothetical protein
MSYSFQRFRFLFADDRSFYGVAANGQLLWYPAWTNTTPAPRVGEGKPIGAGWADFDHVFPSGDGIIYAVKSDGALLWYRDTQRDGSNDPFGSTGWAVNSGNQIGQGWTGFSNLFSDDEGIIYAVRTSGELQWYRDENRDGSNAPDGSVGWAILLGNQIGAGWAGFRHVLPGGNGVIYVVNAKGDLLWYRDDCRDGTNES